MTTENKDVGEDLYAELHKALASESEPEAEEAPVASDQKPIEEVETSESQNNDSELSEEEISKLTPRAQERIRKLAEQVKNFAEKQPEKPVIAEESDTESPKFKDVQDFLAAVEDEPSRKLLETFYGVIKGEISTTLSPIEQANNKAKFESEFSKYEKVEGLADYKNDLLKTYMRNPNQSFKALIGETIADLQLSKVKPVEKSPSSPNRSGVTDLDTLSKDDLYSQLETMRGN